MDDHPDEATLYYKPQRVTHPAILSGDVVKLRLEFDTYSADERAPRMKFSRPAVNPNPPSPLTIPVPDVSTYLDVLDQVRLVSPRGGWRRVVVEEGGEDLSHSLFHIGKNSQKFRQIFHDACQALLENPKAQTVTGPPCFITVQQTQKQMKKHVTPKMLQFNGGGGLISMERINGEHLMLLNQVFFDETDDGVAARDAFAVHDRNHVIARPSVSRNAMRRREDFRTNRDFSGPINIVWNVSSVSQIAPCANAVEVIRPVKQKKRKGPNAAVLKKALDEEQATLFPGLTG